jgi:hypothetical protein
VFNFTVLFLRVVVQVYAAAGAPLRYFARGPIMMLTRQPWLEAIVIYSFPVGVTAD